jgi:hypothetical protein
MQVQLQIQPKIVEEKPVNGMFHSEFIMHVQSGEPRHKHCSQLIDRFLVPNKLMFIRIIQLTLARDKNTAVA